MADNDIEYSIRAIDESTATTNRVIGSNDALISNIDGVGRQADDTSQQLEGLEDKTREVGEQSEKSGMSFADLAGALEVVNKAIGYAEQAYDATIGKAQEYNQTILELMAISGQSAEETSRMVQVLDDWQVSSEQVGAATRKLTAQGLAPNLETLAKLSDQYLKITGVEERNKFVTDNLGVSGRAWNQVLAQGSEALLTQAAAVSKNLIVTEDMLKRGEALRLQQDALQDAADGLGIAIGEHLVTPFTAWANLLQRLIDGDSSLNLLNFSVTDLLGPIGLITELTQDYASSLGIVESQISMTTPPIYEHAEAMQEDAAAASEALISYSDYLSLLGQYQSSLDTFNEKQKDLASQRAETESKLADTPAWKTEQIEGFKQKLDEISVAEADLQAQRDMDQAKFVQQQLEKMLAVDGLSKAEQEYLLQRGVDQGIYSEEAKAALDTALAEATQAAIDQKNEEKAILDERQASFSNYAGAVTKDAEEQRAAIDAYIAKLGEIPSEVNTKVNLEIPDVPSGKSTFFDSGQSQQGVGATVINNYYIQDAHFSDSGAAMSLVG